ncbi:ankyrin repeat domain-containing protein [Nostoc sp. DedQUE09]|uniref:ankyrin repeat domain-containing protein n=1 Tax=Nostoc sp. DedQUE09 TaxID=3075394 RepID=UPI002AD3118D|nr:ankyrin repeat domain-containing protein [Nostoc sp. DedQUE09]MDZ7950435.1 ankyrin repeat domain-containing protein [Nostoc sp. DedQUE09]
MQNNLNETIAAIFQAATGESKTKSSEEEKIAFERLSAAVQAGDIEFIRALVEAEKQHSRAKNVPTLLMAATMEGKTEVVRALIDAGVDVNTQVEEFGFKMDALEFAIDKEYTDIVKILLNAGANPNLNSENPGLSHIRKAVQKGYTEIVNLLIQAGATVKFNTGFRLLVDAAEKSNPEIIQLLVNAGCNVNTRQLGKDTPLTAACRIARIENVQALISAGANVNKVGMHDMAPLVTVFLSTRMNTALAGHGLAEKENNIVSKITQIAQALIEAGADLNVYEVNGKTALMLAVEQSYFDIVKMLIVGGANINALMQPDEQSIFVRGRNIVCKTALHLAVEAENVEAIKMLLEAGANVNIPDSEGKIPLDIAIEKNLTEIAALINYK